MCIVFTTRTTQLPEQLLDATASCYCTFAVSANLTPQRGSRCASCLSFTFSAEGASLSQTYTKYLQSYHETVLMTFRNLASQYCSNNSSQSASWQQLRKRRNRAVLLLHTQSQVLNRCRNCASHSMWEVATNTLGGHMSPCSPSEKNQNTFICPEFGNVCRYNGFAFVHAKRSVPSTAL